MPIPKNKEVLALAPILIWQILFERIRGKLGATYSPVVNTSIRQDHSMLHIGLQIEPNTLKVVKKIVRDSFDELASGHVQFLSLFEEIKSNYLQKKYFSDFAVSEIADFAMDELSNIGRIAPIKEDIEEACRVTYPDIVNMFFKEFNRKQLFWSILTP